MKYYCNPLNLEYQYQYHKQNEKDGKYQIYREAADPSVICFQGIYYAFTSMSFGVYVSKDLAEWEYHRLDPTLPLYDYAPDARVVGEYVYLCASKRDEPCSFFRTKDILNGPWEEITGTFPFWDPNLFQDEDGRLYFYWGCSNNEPIYGVELDRDTMQPLGTPKALFKAEEQMYGFERSGENHVPPKTEAEIKATYQEILRQLNVKEENLSQIQLEALTNIVGNAPYMEGAWMTKYQGKYYLQFACPGTQYNIYADGVYEAEYPLGPFTMAENNPYSYHPGGFMTGAGHGSTVLDHQGQWWHAASMRVSRNHDFERRIGLWRAGFDKDGCLYCDQRYGDWPTAVPEENESTFKGMLPPWFLLSYDKPIQASSYETGHVPELAVNEDVRTWWKASSNLPGEWLEMDLRWEMDVHAVQLNFADDEKWVPLPEGKELRGEKAHIQRYIEEKVQVITWKLEGSVDGKEWFVMEDKQDVKTSLAHDFMVWEEGIRVRYLKLTIFHMPYEQAACVSGFRVFGFGRKEKPKKPRFCVERVSDLDFEVQVESREITGACGYQILWGHAPEKLYHSFLIFSEQQKVGALIKGQSYYVRIDAFNESGITQGEVVILGEGLERRNNA